MNQGLGSVDHEHPDAVDLSALRAWIGRIEMSIDQVTVPAVHRLAAMLDRDDPRPRPGEPLPVGWYSIFFPRVVRQSKIGADGHPLRGDFLPPVPLPRRMFAGRRATFLTEIRVGDELTKTATIQDVTLKTGRSGAMVFVMVRAEIHSPRGLAIVEEQDIVYRGEPDRPVTGGASGTARSNQADPRPAQSAPGEAVWSRRLTPDEVMLFRYSALSYNGHRIHYDVPYVTRVENYPGLVVNGGLTTLLICELARLHARTPLRAYTTRNVRPLFANRVMHLGGQPAADGKSAMLWALDDSAALAVSVEAGFA